MAAAKRKVNLVRLFPLLFEQYRGLFILSAALGCQGTKHIFVHNTSQPTQHDLRPRERNYVYHEVFLHQICGRVLLVWPVSEFILKQEIWGTFVVTIWKGSACCTTKKKGGGGVGRWTSWGEDRWCGRPRQQIPRNKMYGKVNNWN